jgi:hypothetical protein
MIGLVLALVICVFSTFVRLDRDLALYPVLLIVFAGYYVLFGVIGGSTHALLLEIGFAVVFIAIAVIGFLREPLLVVFGLAAHGVFDFVHARLFADPGVPAWWPAFCLSYDVVAAAYFAWRLYLPDGLASSRGASSASARIVVVLLLLGATPSLGHAQSIEAASGARVRVDLFGADRTAFGRERAQSVVATLVSVRGDTMLLEMRPSGEVVRVPRSTVRAAFVSGGTQPRWESALRGAVAPALIGAVLSAASSSIRRRPGDASPGAQALSSAAWGAATGALFGAWQPKERWRPLEH